MRSPDAPDVTDPAPKSPLANHETWDLVAAGYDEFTRPMFQAYSARAAELLGLPPNCRVLDVACGPGTMSFVLSDAGHRVDAIDFSPEMLSRLEVNLERRRALAEARVAPRLMDGQQLDFADETFDAGVSMFGLMFFPDRAKGLRELYRVTRPGGRVAISSWLPLSRAPGVAWMFGVMPLLRPPSDEPPRKPDPVLEDPESLVRELSAAGYRNVIVEAFTHRTAIPDLREFWEVLGRSSAPIALMRESVTEQRWAELTELCVEHLRTTRPPEIGEELEMPAWIAVADRP